VGRQGDNQAGTETESQQQELSKNALPAAALQGLKTNLFVQPS
jgi:hypothetical protein